ncbi:HAD family hydrolase [Oribacterium sp. WCC10]|uniref:HAD family hydrolase n=1 Tax=Oribacterium sp. WCC10 TaxID=1855343 RepID=UPI0008E4E5E8|nr:HAD family hydrolase [Oribacterium sp. WCC10]SFG68884.1 haloacid dehalogenase-like hydrolase [Oribacterium sp. WCC10]
MNQEKKTSDLWKYVAIVLIAIVVALGAAMFTMVNSRLEEAANKECSAETAVIETVAETEAEIPETEAATETLSSRDKARAAGAEILSYWKDDSETKQKLIAFMEDITDESGSKYIPVEKRIAVFDFDGTLFCETDPNYFDYMLLVHRVLEDENYKDKASKFEKQTADKIVKQNETGESFKGLETDHGKSIASSFKGMTIDEFETYVHDFMRTPMLSYDGMTRGFGWYLPMLQIINYLEVNDFTVYIVSGTDRFIVRSIINDENSPLAHMPMSHVIGSDESLVATGQDDEDGLNYNYKTDDKVVTGGDFIIKNLKMNKVTAIAKEIGEQPVLSFGNSTGDSSMAEYVISDNPYESLAFMLCCDDLQRENGNLEKAQKMYDLCAENGWVPVSMKNDWTTIYGDSVTKKNAANEEKTAA